MNKTTLSNIKNLVKKGAATEIKANSIDLKKKLTQVSYSVGSNGVNGALFMNEKTGKLFAITSRNSMLLYYL